MFVGYILSSLFHLRQSQKCVYAFLFCALTNECDFTPPQEFCHGSRDVYELQLAPNCPHAEPRVLRSRHGDQLTMKMQCWVVL